MERSLKSTPHTQIDLADASVVFLYDNCIF